MKKHTKIILTLSVLLANTALANPNVANWFGRTFAPGNGDEVAFLGAPHCEWVSSENNRRPMNCNRNNIGAWEVFTIVNRSGSNTSPVFALRANNGSYVRVSNSTVLRANGSDSTNDRHRFQAFFNSSTSYTNIASEYTNDWVSSEEGNRTMRANRNSAGSWEGFAPHFL